MLIILIIIIHTYLVLHLKTVSEVLSRTVLGLEFQTAGAE